MSGVEDGKLRAYLDGQLSSTESQEIAGHLSQCVRCRERLGQVERSANTVSEELARLSPASPIRDVELALAEIRERTKTGEHVSTRKWRRSLMRTQRNRVWRAIAAGAFVLAILVGVYSFAPTRAIARQLLSVFRVRKFAVIQVNPTESRLEEVGRALEETLFINEPEVVVDEPAVEVSSMEEASALAGFKARMPAYFPGMEAPRIEVKGRSEFVMRFTRDGLVMLLELAGMDSSQLPPELDEGMVTFAAPAMVRIYAPGIEVLQVWNPTIQYPEGIDPGLIGEAGLRILGLSPSEARRISETIDWANTMVLPVPADVVEFRELEIAGEKGVVMRSRGTEEGYRTVLLWQKDDIVYVIGGNPGPETLVQMAESMF